MTPPSALANALRQATKTAHHRLDHHPVLAPLVRDDLTLAQYSQALAALHAPHGAIEACLQGFAPAQHFPARLADLEADLAALGQPPSPFAAVLPDAPGAPEKIGMMYVLEGSNLGATVIARQLVRHLPGGTPQRFFAGPDAGLRWRHFWQFAEAHCTAADIPRATACAIATFDCYREHLDRIA